VVGAGAGNDKVFGDDGRGRQGNGTILAGDGDDLVYGTGGNDAIDGGAGDDTIAGSEGDDRLDGGPGTTH
jgi:Ca2+-binding RTX toxin-like protein